MILEWALYLLGVMMTLLLREFGGFIYRLAKSHVETYKKHREEERASWGRVELKLDGIIREGQRPPDGGLR